jgi:ribosomal protein L16 Arg81 hydroxylase
VEDKVMIEFMTQNGVDEQVAIREVRFAASHPYVEAGVEKAESAQNLESLINIYRALDTLSDNRSVERKSGVSRAEFLRKYYSRNRPVILTRLMQNWAALSLWTPEYLKARYGSETVEITADRDSDPSYELNIENHNRKILFSDFVDMVTHGGDSNDYYLIARNHVLEQEGMKALLEDIESFPQYLNAKTAENIRLWFGPAGAVKQLHCDRTNVFMAQIYGRKRIKLIPSNQLQLVYSERRAYSQVDCENPDYEKYPMFKDATIIDVLLEPGDVLFIPVGWWHHVKALDISISLSMVDFVFPNFYQESL